MVGCDAEQVGEDRGGELGGEVGERGAAAGLGPDPEFAQALAEAGGGERSAGLQAGEQPSGGGWGADADVGSAVAGQGVQQPGEWFGDVQVVPAEAEEYLWSRRVLTWSRVIAAIRDSCWP